MPNQAKNVIVPLSVYGSINMGDTIKKRFCTVTVKTLQEDKKPFTAFVWDEIQAKGSFVVSNCPTQFLLRKNKYAYLGLS